MNLLDLMEDPEQEVPAPNRPPIKCTCPSYYYPTMFVNSHIREDVIALLETRNFRRLAELGVRAWDPVTGKWFSWTTYAYNEFLKTAKPFPKCGRSKGLRDP